MKSLQHQKNLQLQNHQQRLNGIFLQCSAAGIVSLLPLFPYREDLLLKGELTSLL